MSKMIKIFTLLLISLHASLFALGALYARRPLSNTQGQPLWLTHYDAEVTITDQIAVTHVDHTFKNESSSRLEGVFVFPLPENAVVTELALWINGERVIADVMEKDTARAVYENIVRRQIDPALLEYMGGNVFKLSVFPIEPAGHLMSERRIEITYAELLPYENSQVEYRFFMKTANMSSKPVQRASLAVDMSAKKDILSCLSPSHTEGTGLGITRINSNEFSILYGNENTQEEKDFRIHYNLKNDAYALNQLTYVPDMNDPMFFDKSGDDPYFLLWATPPDEITRAEIVKKNIAFMADVPLYIWNRQRSG
ncbi:MAG: hypothetical protein GF401_19545 [Chitinivibrionales bacterium]|nr:hypothetical protein [Chitinivibrionales bacterium]